MHYSPNPRARPSRSLARLNRDSNERFLSNYDIRGMIDHADRSNVPLRPVGRDFHVVPNRSCHLVVVREAFPGPPERRRKTSSRREMVSRNAWNDAIGDPIEARAGALHPEALASGCDLVGDAHAHCQRNDVHYRKPAKHQIERARDRN